MPVMRLDIAHATKEQKEALVKELTFSSWFICNTLLQK